MFALLIGVWCLCGVGAATLFYNYLGEFCVSDVYVSIWLILSGPLSLGVVLVIIFADKFEPNDRILWERKR